MSKVREMYCTTCGETILDADDMRFGPLHDGVSVIHVCDEFNFGRISPRKLPTNGVANV
jgi:hypothetical protein